MKQALHILHVEDSPQDSELVRHMLEDDGLACEFQRVETYSQLFEALEHSECDLILSDCTLPQFSGLQALKIANALKPQVPFIFVSGTIGEETAIESLQHGATDYVLKHRLSRLVPAVRRALTEVDERATLRMMKWRLHQARRLEAIGTLIGGLSYDFTKLLRTLKAHIAQLPMGSDHPEVDGIADALNKTTDRGIELMQELLVFARKTEAHLISIDIATRIGEMAEMLKAGLPRDINLDLQLEKGLPHIFADPEHLDRILTNLIMNAKDAMPHGGCITVSIDLIRFDAASPKSWQIDDILYLRLKVSDTGMGMNENARLHAFEPFFTTKPVGRGTGLGLSVVFGLMQAHNGLIDLQSEVGKGTTISLFFPLPYRSLVTSNMIKKIPPFQLLGDTNASEAIPFEATGT
jgi:two-component system cell cycle sensor histidine kinase/response regulator CckA